MNKLILWAVAVFTLPTLFVSQTTYYESLHATRQGKATWYSAANGGFETLTGIPMGDLPCQDCHAATYANGSAVDAATYTPGCADCHVIPGDAVAQTVCLGCHSRQGAEINLSNHTNPDVAAIFSDVHRTAGMECMDCHTSREMHDFTSTVPANSMFEPGVFDVACTNCHHGPDYPSNTSHAIHEGKLDCNTCHAQTIVACYNCHFETEVEGHMKRFYGPPPINGFALLLNRDDTGVVTTGSFQSVTYGDNTFYAVGRFNGHTISGDARDCVDCHNNSAITSYNDTGEIPVVQWDTNTNTLVNTKGIIPVPEDWQTSLKFDFVRFLGLSTDPIDSPFDPARWEFMKSGADGSHMLYASPLTHDQMVALGATFTSIDAEGDAVPDQFVLAQNYPNPFNPSTTIEFQLPVTTSVQLKVFNILGKEVMSPINGSTMHAGTHSVTLSFDHLNSGVYFYMLQTPEFTMTKKMTLIE